MWGVLTKIFTKTNVNNDDDHLGGGDGGVSVAPEPPSDMEGSKLAKQRASVKWLLSKAFNNKVPENLREPFYRDHENQERLKPQIVGLLANAEIYCMALSNIYSDPNYNNMNHWAILQTLSRKGVYVHEPSDAQLTETTLIQTNPLRMSAHMAVIESIMILYAKEVVTADRVLAAVHRFTHGRSPINSAPEQHEQSLFLWITNACEALKQRIEQGSDSGVINGGSGDRLKPPEILPVNDLKDLSDGVALAGLISFYCPDELPWTEIKVNYVPSVQDSLYNLRLVQDFCNGCLPVSIFHIQPEDVTYLRDTMRQNLIVFLADLFNVVEIHPAKCVRYPGMEKQNEGFAPRNEHGVAHKRNLLQTVMTPIPDLRSGLEDAASSQAFQVSRSTPTHVPVRKATSLLSEMSEDSLRRGPEESFVVHRGKNIPTLRSVVQSDDPNRTYPSKDKFNNHNNEKPEPVGVPAGKPSNWEESKRPSFAGRRSRRNSTSDDSQLTIENFGGSQDNLNFIGRNPDKEVGIHVGRKISAPDFPVAIENPAVRSSLQDARGSIQLGYDNGCEKNDYDETEKFKMKRQLSSDDISLKNIFVNKESLVKDLVDGEISKRMSFADLDSKPKPVETGGVQLVYMQHNTNGDSDKKTTTWQQQSSNNQQIGGGANSSGEAGNQLNVNPIQLNDVRLKLEEKRRMIESEKRRMEIAMNKQRQKVGKAAFLQAVAKGRGSLLKPTETDTNASTESKSTTSDVIPKPQRPFSLKEINEDAIAVERKWLEGQFMETIKTPDLENMDLDQYQQSIAQMNSSLNDIQGDIQRLASQQSQIQAAQQQNLIAQQQSQIRALQQQQYQSLHQQQQQQQQQQQPLYNPPVYQSPQTMYHPPVVGLQSSASAPHIPHSYHTPPNHHQSRSTEQNQFFLHDQSSPQPVVPQRRTWAQQPQPSPEIRSWGNRPGGFVLHDTPSPDYRYIDGSPKYQNGNDTSSTSFTLSQQHLQQNPIGTPSASPQHRSVHRQISQLLDESKRSPVSLQQLKSTPVTHIAIPAPSADDMEPQNISFIGNSEDITQRMGRLNITSGNRTYRIPSPTRPVLSRNSFQPSPPLEREGPVGEVSQSSEDNIINNKKGFYIEFENEPPKRPKPPLRTKRGSPKKERDEERMEVAPPPKPRLLQPRQQTSQNVDYDYESSSKPKNADAIIIENDSGDPDLAERARRRILLNSLQRKQQLEEAKARKDFEAQERREAEKAKEEEKLRKKEEQAARRAAILEQYKLKKAMEEAEREGKVFDKSELMGSLKPTPKMRPRGPTRPRPKTIHIDSGSVEMAEGMMGARGKKGSTSNLTVNATMKRDYYRGSQDSLTDRSLLYRDSPDDSRGVSPCHSTNQTLGRRSSYKTSRDPSPAQARGRPKYTNYQNFKGRKSSSLMNLYGSSTDQDSLAYRYGETDSGLGRATPPRRAPSPGMGSLRHLPSPSGPGSLPGFMCKNRRMFDDGSSDISSTPSSMMDYTGPRLYKQPATKSNRGIMLNAVEYCVFPGVVNREAKKRVLEEINRSESKHFLILFRDAGCQFRALYSYCPDREEITKLYGTGPKQVNDRMFDKFFKYNSGGKCFSQVHTKHLTVTIDAFTIHNALWQGKKVNLPNKKDMTLVI